MSMDPKIKNVLFISIGVCTGLILSLIIFLVNQKQVEKPKQQPVEVYEPLVQEASSPEFTFYDRLSKKVKSSFSKEEESTHAESTPKVYALQTDSFLSWEKADKRRAELLLMGFKAYIDQSIEYGEVRHQVLIGPIDSWKNVKSTQVRLNSFAIDASIVRLYSEV